MSKLATNNLEMLIRSDQQDLDKCERAGIADGEKNLPSQTSRSMSKFETSEITKIAKPLRKLEEEKEKLTAKLSEEKKQMERKLDIQIPKSQDETNLLADSERDQIEKLAGQQSAKHAEISEKLSFAEQSLRNIRMSINNRPLSLQMTNVYLPFMILLAFAEVWINSKAFELFFESSPLISLFLASAVGAMLVFFAHISGTTIKRAQSKEIIIDKPKMYVPMFILNILVVIFIYFLAKMRQAFVAIQEQSSQGFGGELEELLKDPNLQNLNIDAEQTSAIISLISTNLGEAGLFLLLVNLLVYICGFKQYDKYRTALTKVVKAYDDKVASIDKRKSDIHADIRKERDIADERIYEIDKEIEEINYKASEIKSNAMQVLKSRVDAYRSGNRSSRKKPEPMYFNQSVNLE